ncbi:protein of unknown function [Bradyrhizobium vignae]|uniref:Uncharacterized protein n=1 Tax=Bradyrhizobium vignae TaxID=1549949 RepID=A0A2U3PUB4_9BRAD|nr:protein of unknown function [Bradyrhizobium vignae]
MTSLKDNRFRSLTKTLHTATPSGEFLFLRSRTSSPNATRCASKDSCRIASYRRPPGEICNGP